MQSSTRATWSSDVRMSSQDRTSQKYKIWVRGLTPPSDRSCSPTGTTLMFPDASWSIHLARSKNLVITSATFLSPRTFFKFTRPSCASDWTHRSFTSRCLTRPRPRVEAKDFAAAASVPTVRRALTPISLNAVCMASPRDEPSAIAYDSASAEEVATTFCVDDQLLSGCRPNISKPPEVDFRVTRHPAQSLSTTARI